MSLQPENDLRTSDVTLLGHPILPALILTSFRAKSMSALVPLIEAYIYDPAYANEILHSWNVTLEIDEFTGETYVSCLLMTMTKTAST